MINLDGAYLERDHSSGVGIIARDSEEFVLGGLAELLRGEGFHHGSQNS